jgi:hypothetical protein
MTLLYRKANCSSRKTVAYAGDSFHNTAHTDTLRYLMLKPASRATSSIGIASLTASKASINPHHARPPCLTTADELIVSTY